MDHRSGSCAFAEEIVSYLYGEMELEAKGDFESHLPGCVSCTAELAAFQEVRETLGIWKQEVVRTAPAGMISRVTEIRGSQQAALSRNWQRFLDRLFPPGLGWAGAAAALGSLLLVSAAGYGIWRSTADRNVQPIIKVAAVPVSAGGMSSLLNSLAEMATEVDPPSHLGAQPNETNAPASVDEEHIAVVRRSSKPKLTHSGKANSRFSVVEEQQLLADLGVASTQKEETAPRLSDLLGESEVND